MYVKLCEINISLHDETFCQFTFPYSKHIKKITEVKIDGLRVVF